MITGDNFRKVLEFLAFSNKNDIYTKKFDEFDCELKVDFKNAKFVYPKEIKFGGEFTLNFHQNENFVVFECIHNLLVKGYNPNHIELEKSFVKQKKEDGGGRADIIIKKNNDNVLFIIECKTAGIEFNKHWKKTLQDGDQLFRYLTNKRETEFLCIYTSDFVDDKVVSKYNLISLIDNKEYIENNPNLESFEIAKTKNKEDIFKVWCETYGKEYSSQGIFEDEIAPYKIGKTKFTSKDLKNITSKDIQGKYYEFATILRQHNVSGRENAFDKLVNLFLCKVTDEKKNFGELKFYWKGKAYDNPFDFQDRLQKLYKEGMDEFLEDKITYIDNSLIDEAFSLFKDKENETKRLIKEYLKAQKFFTNNDFAFIDVHNEPLFYQNFDVLLKIVRMIQDISLTGSDENQFLGDMFEGFLDQGVKQSEGQFFTPMPIVKFIINSLPDKKEPKVIDYACGAGHFLNEYATINEDSQIVGIEKEYRLSKVAKVSSFMYGSNIKIIYDDALKNTSKVENNSFDVLIANPPYSVKGFLETLSDEDRNSYELLETIDKKSYASNNSIECFFIERSKQLLKKDGIAAIIVPVTILTNKNKLYIKTREIILKHFDIVAISRFGDETFGKTNTTTITLFLKRKMDNPSYSNHLENMKNSWFQCDFETNKVFDDNGILEKYCKYIEVEFDIYKTILCENLNEDIFQHEIFDTYRRTYNKLAENNRKKQLLIEYIREIEKEKFYYFCLAYKNSCDVVIVKSPSDSKNLKKFLGYEWSFKKGKEGIKYLSNRNIEIDDESLDDEDKRILENLQGLKDINTPLYNPSDTNDESKINKIIKENFQGIKSEISEELKPYVSRVKLVDMIDFSRGDFLKIINLTPNKKFEVIGKTEWQQKLDEVVYAKGGNGFPEEYQGKKEGIPFFKVSDMNTTENIPVMNVSNNYVKEDTLLNDIKAYIFDADTIIFPKVGKAIDTNKKRILGLRGCIDNNTMGLIIQDTSKLLPKYLFEFFDNFINLSDISSDANPPSISATNLNEIKIPVPPIDIQMSIVKDCLKEDKRINNLNKIINDSKKEIENIINSINAKKIKLSKVVQTNPSKREISDIDSNILVSFIEMSSISIDGFIDTKVDRKLKSLRKGSYKYFKEDDILIAKITPSMENGKCAIATNLTNKLGMGSSEFHVFRASELLNNKFLFSLLNRDIIRIEAEKIMTGASGHRRVPIEFYEDLLIPLPSLNEQLNIVEKISIFENKIKKSKKEICNSQLKKETILRKYLES